MSNFAGLVWKADFQHFFGNILGLGAYVSKPVFADHDSIETVEAVVANGTNTNTGWKEGFIAHVERDLRRNLFWLICIAHGKKMSTWTNV